MTDQTSAPQHKIAVYDIETLSTLFTACFYDLETQKQKEFVVYDEVEDFKKFVSFLRSIHKNGYELVGFNCLNFDSQVLEFIIINHADWLDRGVSAQEIVRFIYQKAQDLINADDKEKWKTLIPEWKLTLPHIDVFKQKHYDGKAKMGTSLKWLQFSMRYPTVEDMPIKHDSPVEKHDIATVLQYNWNDVHSTAEFFRRNKFETDLRRLLSDKYNLRLLNASEPRLAKMIFGKFLCDAMNIEWKDLREMRTFRKEVKLKSIVLPYIKFQSPELQAVLDTIKTTTINPNIKTKFKLEFEYGGIKTDVGLGGIHACCTPGHYKASDDMVIHDVDVVSFYPRLAIVNGLRPKHLGEVFNIVYDNIFKERQKIPKKDPINYVYKIILNSTYGLSKEINSYLYDPAFTYAITINGQLSLLMLVESLVGAVPGLKIFQENTDGITLGYHPDHRELVARLCDEWCGITKLELEHAHYKEMVIRDVNNYMAIKPDVVKADGTIEKGFDWQEYQAHIAAGKKRSEYGKIKHKGTFELELDYHKNPSFLVIPMAAESHFFGTLSCRDFISQHDNIFDFLGGVKKKADFDLNLNVLDSPDDSPQHVKKEQQKVTRYYISTSGAVMTKDYHSGKKEGGTVCVEASWKVRPLNVVTETSASKYPDLNRVYYIREADKLVNSITKNANQLKLF